MKLQKTIWYKISQWCHYQSDLQIPNSATNGWITFYLCSYSKLVSAIIFISPENPLKSYKKSLLLVSSKNRFLTLFEIGLKNQKKSSDFTKIFDNPFAKYPITNVFLNALIVFLAIYQIQSKHSRLVLHKKNPVRWYSFHQPWKSERLIWSWSHPVVLTAWQPSIGNPAP